MPGFEVDEKSGKVKQTSGSKSFCNDGLVHVQVMCTSHCWHGHSGVWCGAVPPQETCCKCGAQRPQGGHSGYVTTCGG